MPIEETKMDLQRSCTNDKHQSRSMESIKGKFRSPIIAILYNWNKAQLRILLDNVDLIEDSKRPMLGIMIPNHTYDLDYMICFVLADQLGNMGSYKSMSKDELKYFPVIGWTLWMSDIIFLKRNWLEDREQLGLKLNTLFSYEQCLLGLFAEGTRWTQEKHKKSVEFAKSRSIEPLKYHLIPRHKGFNFTIRHYLREMALNKRMDPNLLRLFNLQMQMPEIMTFSDFMNGKEFKADIYCEEIHITDDIRSETVNSTSEEKCPKLNELLINIYRRKDELVHNYRINDHQWKMNELSKLDSFNLNINHGVVGYFPFRRKILPTIIWCLSMCFTTSVLIYLASIVEFATFSSILVGYMVICYWLLTRIEFESQSKKTVAQ